jgi:hypothetical protein
MSHARNAAPVVLAFALAGVFWAVLPALGDSPQGGGRSPQQAAAGGAAAAGPLDPNVTTLTVYPSTGILSDGSASATVVVVALDAAGLPISGGTVTLAATGTGNTLTQPSAVTDSLGVATGTLATTVAESKTINGSIDVGSGDVAITATGTVVFVSGDQLPDYTPGAPTITGTLGATPQTIIDLTLSLTAVGTMDEHDGWLIEESDDGGAWFTTVEDTGSTGTLVSITGLSAGGTYNFRGHGRNGTIVGAVSNETGDIVTAVTLDPNTIFGGSLVLWYDADDDTTITLNVADVTGWANKATTTLGSYDLTGGASDPVQDTTTFSLNTIQFIQANGDGLQEEVETPFSSLNDVPRHVWVVCATPNDGFEAAFGISVASTRQFNVRFRGDVGGDPVAFQVQGDEGAVDLQTTTSYTVNTLHIIYGWSDATNAHGVRLDNAGETLDTSSRTDTDPMTRIYVAGSGTPGQGDVWIAEIVVSKGATTEQKAQIQTYLSAKWQFVLFLPGFGFVAWGRRKRSPLTLEIAA